MEPAELVVESAAEPVAEPVAERCFLCITASFSTAFPFIVFFFYSKLLLLASSTLSSLSPTTNTPSPARLPAGLYRAALHTGPVTATALGH